MDSFFVMESNVGKESVVSIEGAVDMECVIGV